MTQKSKYFIKIFAYAAEFNIAVSSNCCEIINCSVIVSEIDVYIETPRNLA